MIIDDDTSGFLYPTSIVTHVRCSLPYLGLRFASQCLKFRSLGKNVVVSLTPGPKHLVFEKPYYNPSFGFEWLGYPIIIGVPGCMLKNFRSNPLFQNLSTVLVSNASSTGSIFKILGVLESPRTVDAENDQKCGQRPTIHHQKEKIGHLEKNVTFR